MEGDDRIGIEIWKDNVCSGAASAGRHEMEVVNTATSATSFVVHI